MKKLLLMLSMLSMVGLVFAEEGPNRRGSLDGAGSFNGPDEKFFVSVKNGSGGALVSGDVVILDVSADDGYTATTSTTAGDFPHCVLAEACASTAMCKCQTYGLATDVNFTPDQNNAVAGAPAFISESQAGKVDAITSPAFSDRPIGVFYDASSASGDVEVFIKLR
jgi:hypothetical protein